MVCPHGVLTSSYPYRKVIPALGSRGVNAVALDLPGTGLADRATDFDYTWSGLGAFAAAAVDALGLRSLPPGSARHWRSGGIRIGRPRRCQGAVPDGAAHHGVGVDVP